MTMFYTTENSTEETGREAAMLIFLGLTLNR